MSAADHNLPVTAPRSHLTPFKEGLRPWLVLARNAIPVIGVYALHWSSNAFLFQLWFDGVAALGAMIALHMRAFILTDPKARLPASIPPEMGFRVKLLVFSIAWLVIVLLLGIPYWFALFFFSATLFQGSFWTLTLRDPAILVALLVVLISHVIEEFRRGYERMSAAEASLEFNWDFSMHLTRIGALLFVAFFFGKFIMIPLALMLSYIEIYPMRSLRLIGGDRTLAAENEARSRD
jgi:hypothetical protein